MAVLLIVVAAVAGFAWIGYRAQHPTQLNYDEVRSTLVGERQSAVETVTGWGSVTYGLDDGQDWIEFTTDAPGLRLFLDSRPFVRLPADREAAAGIWAEQLKEWGGERDAYEDDSEFETNGTGYYLFVQTRDDSIQALIARLRQ
ncbi:hypothetical protein [Haloferula sp.]|uniref:hypothetical protein n=1 Tax=Haloferula sp. TaxID=2497595 RepID=UPI00329B378A